MVRALISLLLFATSSIAQTTDSVSVFKIRPPEKRIRGLFCNPYSEQKSIYYFSHDGTIRNFGIQENEQEFHNKLIINQEDLKYEKGTYFLERGSEKAVMTLFEKEDTTYLLGKYRSGRFYLTYSDTMIVTDKWNVGSFIIAKSKEEKEDAKQKMRFMEKSVYNKSCGHKTFWGGTVKVINLDLSDTAAYRKKKKQIEAIPEEDIKSFNGTRFEYYIDKYYNFFESDSQIVVGYVTDSCGSIKEDLDSIKTILPVKHWKEWYGAQNYLTQFEGNYVWSYRHECTVDLKFYSSKQINRFLKEPRKEIFEKIKSLTPNKTINLNQICEITF